MDFSIQIIFASLISSLLSEKRTLLR